MLCRILLGLTLSLIAEGSSASCRIPFDRVSSPDQVASLMLAEYDFVGFAQVSRPLDLATGTPEQISPVLRFKGPTGVLSMRSPVVRPNEVMVTNNASSFDLKSGAVFFTVLKQTKTGWSRSECGDQLINRYPLPSLIARLETRSREQR